MLPGSGLSTLRVPLMSNASEAMVPTALSEADDGPLFSSQYSGSPNEVVAFCKFNQPEPEPTFSPVADTLSMS